MIKAAVPVIAPKKEQINVIGSFWNNLTGAIKSIRKNRFLTPSPPVVLCVNELINLLSIYHN